MSTSGANADALAADTKLLTAVSKIKRFYTDYEEATKAPGSDSLDEWKKSFADGYAAYIAAVIEVVRDYGCPGLHGDVDKCINIIKFFGLDAKSDELQKELAKRSQ